MCDGDNVSNGEVGNVDGSGVGADVIGGNEGTCVGGVVGTTDGAGVGSEVAGVSVGRRVGVDVAG